jgi:hypothetical protein
MYLFSRQFYAYCCGFWEYIFMRLLNKMFNVNLILGNLIDTAGLCFCFVCVGQATGC